MTCNGNLSYPPTCLVYCWRRLVKTVWYRCLMQTELIQFWTLTVGLTGVKVWRRTARNLTYEDWNTGTVSTIWEMREIKIYPIEMKIAGEIDGEYSFYHLTNFTPRSYASGVICTCDTLPRVQVGGAKPRSACPCRQHPPFLSALTPPKRQHLPSLPPFGLWKKMPARKQSALVTHWEILRRSRKV